MAETRRLWQSTTGWKRPGRSSSATRRTAGTRSSPRPRCSAKGSSPGDGRWTSAKRSSGQRRWATTSRLDPYFDVPYTVSADDWGLETVYHRTESLGSCVWDAPVKDYDADLKKLHAPRFEIDWKTTRGCLDLACEVFQGILPARLKGIWWWSLGVTMPAVFLRGLTNLLYDLYENPQGLKELLAIISRGHMEKLDYLESQ